MAPSALALHRVHRAQQASTYLPDEPLAPNEYQQLAGMSDALGCRIVLDESLLRVEQLAALPEPLARWMINVRVSKMGGLLRSLKLVDAARRSGLGVIVGAQVGERAYSHGRH